MFLKNWTKKSTSTSLDSQEQIKRLQEAIENAEAILIGAGAGLSTAAGLTYSGKRFDQYFSDFEKKYGFSDMYSGGFYPYPSPEEFWAFWSRNIFINRYMDAPKSVYQDLYQLVKDKNYFVLTTNVDHAFQKAGFDKKRLFYTQGDYGLFQCSDPCRQETYDNQDIVRKMVEAQGYVIDPAGNLTLPAGVKPKMEIPSELIPYCPYDGKPMTTNLRIDSSFVEDEGWHQAAKRYSEFLEANKHTRILYLELGVGANTPGIIKYPFWQMTAANPNAFYACINYGEAFAPRDIEKRSLCMDGDIGRILEEVDHLKQEKA